jgi:hypothetical protein
VTNTLFLPGEVLVYWLEHALLLLIPVVLLQVYTVPRFRWVMVNFVFFSGVLLSHNG